jgi:hypothetical protein
MPIMPTEQISRELLEAALEGLERKRETLESQIADVRRMLGGRPGVSDSTRAKVSAAPVRRRQRMSAAGRKRIAEAQRKRWAALKQTASPTAKKTARPAPAKKHRISAEGRARIIAATKKRWAAFRASKKSAAKA